MNISLSINKSFRILLPGSRRSRSMEAAGLTSKARMAVLAVAMEGRSLILGTRIGLYRGM